MTKYPDLFAALASPFDHDEIKVRSQGGRQVQYVTARTVMNRLDSVLGPENWWDEYVPLEHSVVCKITIRLPDESTITKSDAGGYAGLADSGDDDKAGFSDAFKRACVKIGVGRYLYRDGVPNFASSATSTPAIAEPTPAPAAPQPNGNGKAKREYKGGYKPPAAGAEKSNGHAPPAAPARPGPTNGNQLYQWIRNSEKQHDVGLLRYINSWAKQLGFPGRIVEWDETQVELGLAEVERKLQAIRESTNGDRVYSEAS